MLIIYGIYFNSSDGCTYSSEGFMEDKFYLKKEDADKERTRMLTDKNSEYFGWENEYCSLKVKEIEVKI